jgi:hypothetical protein
MEPVKLECWNIGYCSNIDEDQFFGWLDKIPSVKKYYGKGSCLYLEVPSDLNDTDLRELIAIFQRYNIDLKPLRQFLTEENKDWFL